MPRQKQTARKTGKRILSDSENDEQDAWDEFDEEEVVKTKKPTSKKQKTAIDLTSDSENDDEFDEEGFGYEEEASYSKKSKSSKKSSTTSGIQKITSKPNYGKQFATFAKKIEGTWIVIAGEGSNRYLHEGTLKISSSKSNRVSIEFDFNGYTGEDTGNCHVNPDKNLLKWRFLCADEEGEQLPGQGFVFEPKNGIITGFVDLPAFGSPFWGRKTDSKISDEKLRELAKADNSYTEWKKKADANDDYSLDQTLSEEESWNEARVARWH